MKQLASAFGALGLMAGCYTSGIGSGSVTRGEDQEPGEVVFAWRAPSDATHGTISARMPDGTLFQGTFMQITSTTVGRERDPFWGSWAGSWYEADYADGKDATRVTRHYSGLAVAVLDGPNGEHMRCRFQLALPEKGPRSGGQGDCQLSTGEKIQYARLRGPRARRP